MRGAEWWRLYPAPAGEWDPVSPPVAAPLRQLLQLSLAHQMAELIFDNGGRDLESLGAAFIAPLHDLTGALPTPGQMSPMQAFAPRCES